MDKGISNIEIEKFFHNEQNEDLRKNYMDYINFIQ